jgi:hypothetical protein
VQHADAGQIGLRVTCMIFIGIHMVGAAIEVSAAVQRI